MTQIRDEYSGKNDPYKKLVYGKPATVSKDRWRDHLGREYTQYNIKYTDGSGEFVRVPVANLTDKETK